MVNRNCNVFSDALSTALTGHGIPAWVNRLAAFGLCCSCFLPPEMQAKPKVPTGSGGGGGSKQTDKLLSGSGHSASDQSFVAFSGAGNSLSSSNQTDSKSNSTASNGLNAAVATGSGSGSGSGGGGGSSSTTDEKREKMRRAALDRLNKSKSSAAADSNKI